MVKLKRYTVVIDTYVYAQGDEEARKIAHDIRKKVNGEQTRILEIDESPFASLETRPLEDLSEPKINGDTVWTEEDELPF
jgi:capsular polysaccharide biosynthesis protein|tara:strand:+ start:341 stop:580 length:240 start_codon:yes stop_codon:yes gene_type:complete